MINVVSKYASYLSEFRRHPEGRWWINPETGNRQFMDYGQAYIAVRRYLIAECDWSPAPKDGDGPSRLFPEGRVTNWFDYGDTEVRAEGERILIFEVKPNGTAVLK